MRLEKTMVEALNSFTHLEVHSHYTILGATPSIPDLIRRASAQGLTHLALTDTNALYGVVSFHQACREAGIQPIIGMTLAVAWQAVDSGIEAVGDLGHLLLLARDNSGYRSLCRLSSLIQGERQRDRALSRGIRWTDLEEHSDGLICISGGKQGWISRFLRQGDREEAERYALKLSHLFGEDTFLSMEIHSPDDAALSLEINNLGNDMGLPVAVVHPIYYLDPAEKENLRLLMAIDGNCPLNEVKDVLRDRYWLTREMLAARYSNYPEALAWTGQIAARCGNALPDGRPIFPAVNFVEGQGSEKSAEDQLDGLATSGLAERYGPQPADPIRRRLKFELKAINDSGFAPLFLIVADIVRFSRENDIPVSTRGSVANSLAAYCSGITTVDPILHDLLFERFMNPARLNPPDIDLDFCSRRRDEVLVYVRDRYGEDRVALVSVISTMQPKSAVRETAKAMGLSESAINKLLKRVPHRRHPDPRRREGRSMSDLAAELEEPRMREVVSAADEIVGQPHHLSIHPGGLVITPGPLPDFVPLQWTPKGFLVTQFGHEDLERIGLPKLDLLGIRALTVLADAADLVREHHDPAFHLENIPTDDKTTGDLIERGDSIGVFQCESAGAQRTLRQLRARTVQDLAVANAFFKPGPATGGMAQAFIRRYRGEENVEYLHPSLEPILKATKGVLLFQEQILRVATEIAGLNWEQADHLRRGMSKFKPEEMDALASEFITGCQKPQPEGRSLSWDQAMTLWDQVIAFAGYGFNRGHATAYAEVSYRSAHLKAHWPAAFLCARLADRGGFHHPAIYIAEAVRLGISIKPPHINFSDRAFTLTPAAARSPAPSPQPPILWMGLDQIRDLRRSSVKCIIKERNKRPFKGLNDLLKRVSLQQKEIAHLIQCGALDNLGSSRSGLLEEARIIQLAGSALQKSFSFAGPEVESESPAERLAWEKFILGQPISVHPLDMILNPLPNIIPISRLRLLGPQPAPHVSFDVVAVRLPGWTGGPGFFLGDRTSFITVRPPSSERAVKTPEPWRPLWVRGRMLMDEWGSRWLQAEHIKEIPTTGDSMDPLQAALDQGDYLRYL